MSSAPYFFEQVNACNSLISPNTVHIRNTGLSRFFQKYLLQKALTPFEFTLPETWPKNYFLYVLYLNGFIAVVNTDRYGVICQDCTLGGYNVFYQPTHAYITNPLLSRSITPRIDVDCTVIRLQPDYTGIGDIVAMYADLMAITLQSTAANVLNSRLAFILMSKNKAAAETLKGMSDRVLSGDPVVAVDKGLFSETGDPLWMPFVQNLSQNFIAPEQLEMLRTIEQMFCEAIGLPNANTGKKERMIVDEVNVNNFATRSRIELQFEELQKSIEKTREMFGFTPDQLNIKWREGARGESTAAPAQEVNR